MMQNAKKLLSLLLCLCMVLSAMPVYAEEVTTGEIAIEDLAQSLTQELQKELEEFVSAENAEAPEEKLEEEKPEDTTAMYNVFARIDSVLLHYFGDQFADGKLTKKEILEKVNSLSAAEIQEQVFNMDADTFISICKATDSLKQAVKALSTDHKKAAEKHSNYKAMIDAVKARKDYEAAAKDLVADVVPEVSVDAMQDALSALTGQATGTPAEKNDGTVVADEELTQADSTNVDLSWLNTAKEQNKAAMATKNAVDAVRNQVKALADQYYREFDGELWILFETMLAINSVEDLFAFCMDYEEAMAAYEALKDAEKAEIDAEFAAELDFLAQFYAEIEAQAEVLFNKADETSWFQPAEGSSADQYYVVVDEKHYKLAPGATEATIILNSKSRENAGKDRKEVHVFAVGQDERMNDQILVMPGYYGIDKLEAQYDKYTDDEVDELKDGTKKLLTYDDYSAAPHDEKIGLKVTSDKALTQTVAYYESLGYNVVGAMNTALAYDSNVPYGFMVFEGKVLTEAKDHYGAQTYLAVNWDGTCELRNMPTKTAKGDPLTGNERYVIPANFGWLVKGGKLTSTTVERTSSDASRSMLGIKADGTLLIVHCDGRNGEVSSGLSNYEMGELMLALGCVNAVNGDGGGSSTFISKRLGETEQTMRSTPSDGSERPTINSIILVKPPEENPVLETVTIKSDYQYIVPNSVYKMELVAQNSNGDVMELPKDGDWTLSDNSYGSIADGVFTSNGKVSPVIGKLENGEDKYEPLTITYTVKAMVKEKNEETKEMEDVEKEFTSSVDIVVLNPQTIRFAKTETVLEYGKTTPLKVEMFATKDELTSAVYFTSDAFTWNVSDETAGTEDWDNLRYTAIALDENKEIPLNKDGKPYEGVVITATYKNDTTVELTLKITYGIGSERVPGWDFENGTTMDFVGFEEAKAWSKENGINNTLVGNAPLAGQFNSQIELDTFVATKENGQVKNGNYALGVSMDFTDADFAGWSYNVIFNIGERVVLRDVENGKKATTLGFWLYIPEGAAGLAFQSQLFVRAANGSTGCAQSHFMFTTVSGVRKNLNSCTEADIPANRWVYASIDISGYPYVSTMDPVATANNDRSPSFIRTYVKPTTASTLTFYIDDITLDYSDAKPDRDPPSIENLAYTTADEAKELTDDTNIKGNSVVFSATVKDPQKDKEKNDIAATGLDPATAQIYVDGVPVATQLIGNVMSTVEAVALSNGEHRVTFEIADIYIAPEEEDDLDEGGNKAQKSVIFTVQNEEQNLVRLDGHNDSGAKPEIDSIYYVDIWTTDVEDFKYFEANILLNTANTWELEQLEVAPGFKVEVSLVERGKLSTISRSNSDIHNVDNVVMIKLTKMDDCTLTGEQKLVSLPVRLWSWDGYDYVTELPIAPETQFATGYCPIVTVDYEVLTGSVENTAGVIMPVFAKKTVETMINDNVNPWHKHDTELTVLNKEATCLEAGYTNRTYCEGCKSVIDWGTAIPAVGHTYTVSGEQLVCSGCEAAYVGTGLVKVNNGTEAYYMIAGTLQTGWHMPGAIADGYCYADPTTKQVYIGCEFSVDGVTYTADENGLTKGAWVENYFGKRYSIGPKFYRKTWATIDGEQYYFGSDNYAYTGYQLITDNTNNQNSAIRWFHFDAEGVLIDDMKEFSGFLIVDGEKYCVTNGQANYYVATAKLNDNGIADDNGSYYYLNENGKVMVGSQWTSSYLMKKSKYPLPLGTYEFGPDGKMLEGVVVKEDGTYYYEMGKLVNTGWLKVGSDYYVFTDGGKALVGRHWVGTHLTQTSKNPYKVGTFIFNKAGKLANGIVPLEGTSYYCEQGVPVSKGLVKAGEDYYYADEGGVLATGNIWVGTYSSNGLLSKGYYEFGADGKMLNGVVEKADGVYYYVQGKPVDTGWLKVGSDYYVFTNGGKALTGKQWVGTYLTKTSKNPYRAGNFFFDEDGKLANGVIKHEDGLYYYQNGVTQYMGLIKADGKYYYVGEGGKLETGRIWVGTYGSNGLIAKNYYEFNTVTGEMANGVLAKGDGLYYYENGRTAYMGLIERNGEYYFVNTNGKLEIGRVWVGTYDSKGLVAKGYYEFGADGAMLNGFEQLEDGLYYYTKGTAHYYGLKVIGSDLYYIDEGGKVVTGYVWVGTYASNGLIPKGYYTFAENGKLVK